MGGIVTFSQTIRNQNGFPTELLYESCVHPGAIQHRAEAGATFIRITSYPMRLFATDLFRNFAIGFVGGALLVAGANADSWGSKLSSPAQAAETLKAPAPSAEFVIAR
ncbi:hypothetical protein ABIE62_002821 [Porphyrobacter sp. MBR-155]|jgi:hypothetical protein|uniref:hypothetical protein n=1 Tax=Porphyrobacter sp. MBR-155 TaxID=3156464 RepID=UPI003392EA52